MDQDCIKLTGYFSGHQTRGRIAAGALADLYGTGGIAVGIVLRGTDGSGLRHHLRGRGPELVTLERARLLSGDIDPVGMWDNPGEATRLTVYFSRQDRIYQVPAAEVICELLHRRGMNGATVLTGIDGTFSGHGAGPPMMVTAIGDGQRLGLVLPEIGDLLRHPVITLEQVRVCKRDGQLISPPQVVSGSDADGRPLWQKLTVYACGSVRHDGQSVHRAINRRLHAVGIGGVITLHGLWGFRGDRVPHGGRHTPAVTIAVDAPGRMSAAFSVIDELTAGRGLVTSETVAAVRRPSPSRDA